MFLISGCPRRKLVYEYDADRSDDDIARNRQPVVSIDIPFNSIVGLKVEDTAKYCTEDSRV